MLIFFVGFLFCVLSGVVAALTSHRIEKINNDLFSGILSFSSKLFQSISLIFWTKFFISPVDNWMLKSLPADYSQKALSITAASISFFAVLILVLVFSMAIFGISYFLFSMVLKSLPENHCNNRAIQSD